ncbi:GNAT family N-acetyltransferase [Chondromyces apiculatus]|uniref:N-acetyltransferase domain-containing protein n=1 Tax=Chondromyces apiculatus DSM 436 TaxID=1192034 RepID=A0A017TFB8_9BACT|nr:GNAT family N-acetyltransferase [Chondromyces apiculatus]EYF07587.1 Hypothetical protein CAP_8710 [Chondromyces apiculatus DSM 436]
MPTYVPRLDQRFVIEASRHTHSIWGSGRSLDEHATYTLAQLDRAGPDLLRYVGLVDATGLVASAKRYSMQLAAPDGSPLPAVGIGAVFTREDARDRGHAATLVREILREATAEGLSAAWLHSEIDPAYYTRLGFLPLPGLAHRAATEDLPEGAPLGLRPATADDIPRLLAWYEAGYDHGWLRPARSPALWRYFAFRNPTPAFILEDQGHDLGYLSANPTPQALWVNEWSAPGVPRPRILATLRALAARHELRAITGWLRPDQVDPVFRTTGRAAGIPMIHLLASPWTAETIDPARTHFGAYEYF